jgi:hypothetical protein
MLDGLLDPGVGGVRDLAYPLADRLLPVGQPGDVLIDPGVGVRAGHGKPPHDSVARWRQSASIAKPGRSLARKFR